MLLLLLVRGDIIRHRLRDEEGDSHRRRDTTGSSEQHLQGQACAILAISTTRIGFPVTIIGCCSLEAVKNLCEGVCKKTRTFAVVLLSCLGCCWDCLGNKQIIRLSPHHFGHNGSDLGLSSCSVFGLSHHCHYYASLQVDTL